MYQLSPLALAEEQLNIRGQACNPRVRRLCRMITLYWLARVGLIDQPT
jgi:hypothetical protein